MLNRSKNRGVKGVLGLLGGAAVVVFVWGNWPDKALSIAIDPVESQVAKQPSAENLAKATAIIAEGRRIRQEDAAKAAEAAVLAEQQARAAAVIAQQQLEEEPAALKQIKALREAMSNFQTCDAYFGADADAPDPEAYNICMGAAAKLFLRRIGDLTQPISVETQEKAAAILTREEVADSALDANDQRNAPAQEIVESACNFECCARRFRDDRGVCVLLFPNDNEAQQLCKDVALEKFRTCAVSIQQAPL